MHAVLRDPAHRAMRCFFSQSHFPFSVAGSATPCLSGSFLFSIYVLFLMAKACCVVLVGTRVSLVSSTVSGFEFMIYTMVIT